MKYTYSIIIKADLHASTPVGIQWSLNSEVYNKGNGQTSQHQSKIK